MKKINIGFDIDLEKLIETRLLVQANSGGGKSFLLRKFMEVIHGKVPFIVIDLEGEFVTLREKFDVIIMGKGHDIPLNVEHAGKIASYLLELHATAILDLSEMKNPERMLFVKLFLESMMDAPKHLWHPTVVIIDEAHQFCPEMKDKKDGAIAAEAVVDLCTRGRKRGYCAVLATQRISSLRKGAIAQVNNKVIGRTSLDTDVKRTAFELGMTPTDAQRLLPKLDEGEFYTYGSAISKNIEKHKISAVKTTHATIGMRFVKTAPPSNAIQKLIDKISDIPKEVEQEKNTVKQLQAKIFELEKQARSKVAAVAPVRTNGTDYQKKMQDALAALEQQKDLAAAYQKQNNQSRQFLKNVFQELSRMEENQKKAEHNFSKVICIVKDKINEPEPVRISPAVNASAEQPGTPIPKEKIVDIRIPNTNPKPVTAYFGKETGDKKLGEGERKILIVCGQFAEGVEPEQLTVMTGYKRSSRNTYLQRLKQRGLIGHQGSQIVITDQGIEALGEDYQPLPTGDALREYWMKELPQGEKVLLELICQAYPGSISREALTEQSNYLRSSRNTYLQRMSSKKIIEAVGKNEVKASKFLFE